MGLAVLPARLADELTLFKKMQCCPAKRLLQMIKLHLMQFGQSEILKKYSDFNADNAMDIIRYEVGRVFEQVLEDAGYLREINKEKKHLQDL